jgi:predicted RNase H-like nuclease
MSAGEPTLVGIDLAWGERARTGVAVADGTGRLVDSRSVRTDEEITAFVNANAGSGPLVAAIDAPLVVRNPTGRRACEAEVQRLYGRYGAAAYPANLTNPAFANGTRGSRICSLLRLDIVSASTAPRRAVEVYPHPAMVVLFELDYVIPYKSKQGRTLDGLKAAFHRLTELMEQKLPELQLADHQRWHDIRRHCRVAQRKSELGAVEDELDAIFCAYLAYLWHRDASATNDLLGDDATGCIIVPRPRRSLPKPGRPALPPLVADQATAPDMRAVIAAAAPQLSREDIDRIHDAVRAALD